MLGKRASSQTDSEHSSERTVDRRSVLKTVGGTGIVATAGCMGELTGESNQEWPSRQVTIVSPWAAGGGADRTSRAVADAAESYTDVSWNVSNQTGGSGSVGMNEVANSQPTGHTLGCTAPEICLFEHLGTADLSPDDITPIMQYTQMPATIVVHQNSDYTSLDEFLSYVEDNPGEIKMANSGTGSSWHMAGTAFEHEMDLDLKHVAYDGAAPAVTAAVNGEVDCATVGAVEVAPKVRDGPLTALGVMYDEQLESLPETPTMQEQGVDVVIGSWLAHFGPKDLSDDVRDSIIETYNSVYEDDEFKNFMDNNNFLRVKRESKELKDFLDEQYEYYKEITNNVDVGEQ